MFNKKELKTEIVFFTRKSDIINSSVYGFLVITAFLSSVIVFSLLCNYLMLVGFLIPLPNRNLKILTLHVFVNAAIFCLTALFVKLKLLRLKHVHFKNVFMVKLSMKASFFRFFVCIFDVFKCFSVMLNELSYCVVQMILMQ